MPNALRNPEYSRTRSYAVTASQVVPASRPAQPPAPGGLRIALCVYRGNPTCGGQGVYTRHLSRELVALGHSVEVFAGPPWPELDDGVGFTPVPSLNLYRQPDPFRWPLLRELRTWADWCEFVTMCVGGFGEPRAFSMRVRKLLAHRRHDFDILHDNQSLGRGIGALARDGWPTLATVHHPITVDREIALAHATTREQRRGLLRWYRFIAMQQRVVQRIRYFVTVSHNSREDLVPAMGISFDRMAVVPVGVETDVFRPYDDVVKVPGRLMVTSSSDVAMKGLVPLLEAMAILRRERSISLTLIGRPTPGGRVERAIGELGLDDIVSTIAGVSDVDLARLYGAAEVAVVPSLYEGFSLPAIEAMSCGVPVVATTGGAIPEVVGPHDHAALLVEPNQPSALAAAIATLLDDPPRRERLGRAGRLRVQERFTWAVTARGTAACYHAVATAGPLPRSMGFDEC